MFCAVLAVCGSMSWGWESGVVGLGVGSRGAGCCSVGSGVVMVSDECCSALCTWIQLDIHTDLSVSDPDL